MSSLFKMKTDMDGNVHTFKACLVAKGFTQTYEVDYGETFSPVAYIKAIRILLAIANFYYYEIWQMDVKTTFLNSHLNKVCKLQRSIYGLKQASRRWNKRFDEEIKKIGFSQNLDERCVYLKASGSNVAFLIHLGEATYILGIKIIRDRSKRLIALSQRAYLEKIIKKFRMENSKKGYTPMMEKPDYRKFNHTAMKTILKYLRNTKDIILMYEAKPKAELKIRKFIDGLGDVMPSNKRPMEMLCDNEPAIAIAADPRILKGAKHFQRKYHYIREVIQEREFVLKKVHIDDNVSDPFTKSMLFNKHFKHAMAIEIVAASSLM
ncbi:retrotransposon protein, putative, ty1-copia subclass [Tanacetum coccineum]